MNVFTVSLFGHRKIDNLQQVDNALFPIIQELMRTREYVSFLVGRSGEFDEYAASVIKRVQKVVDKGNGEMTLVLPYTVADLEYYENYYDNIVIPDNIYGAHPKAAIALKNKWMIEQSSLVIVYVKYNGGGAYAAMKYAERLKKRIINLYESALP